MVSDHNKKDQYNRRNNTELQRIPSNIDDDSFEDKVIEMLAEIHTAATKSDIEDCHRLGGNGNTTVRFVNRKFCNDILEKNSTYTKTLTSLNLVLVWTLKVMLVKV